MKSAIWYDPNHSRTRRREEEFTNQDANDASCPPCYPPLQPEDTSEHSAERHEVLHRFEVVLRNALDEQLCHRNSVQRDRVAHLGPLLNSSMVADRPARMRTVLLAIEPVLDTWFVSRQRVTAVLKTKPQ